MRVDLESTASSTQENPKIEWVDSHHNPSTAEKIADEPLLDALGVLAVGVGVGAALNGNPKSGLQWAGLGFAAISGKKALEHRFKN